MLHRLSFVPPPLSLHHRRFALPTRTPKRHRKTHLVLLFWQRGDAGHERAESWTTCRCFKSVAQCAARSRRAWRRIGRSRKGVHGTVGFQVVRGLWKLRTEELYLFMGNGTFERGTCLNCSSDERVRKRSVSCRDTTDYVAKGVRFETVESLLPVLRQLS